ncbi:MAG: nuclear transport factor 2 family protein [Hyphomonadaceae bacterium]|nr:nuclear transport factor 2 family protein [Hyphomonadaceae bacterium]
MQSNETIVRAFIAAWSRLDVEELLSYFAADGVYHNMPIGPIAGHERLRPFIQNFLKGWTATTWDIRAILASGDLVMVERLDRTRVGNKPVDLPCCGVFEMKDGKIQVWRDYFDMATYTRALS